MPKHKKTRQEKIISDLRRKLQTNQNILEYPSVLPEVKVSLKDIKIKKSPILFRRSPSETNYSYLKHDLLRTSGITLIIALMDLLLLFTIKKHIFNLSIMGY